MRATYAVFCDYASVADHGKVNLLGIFSVIYATRVPAKHLRCYFAAELLLSKQELQKHEVEFTLTSPSGKDIATVTGDFDATQQELQGIANSFHVPVIIELETLLFEELGAHPVKLAVDGKKVATATISIETPSSEKPRKR